MLTAQLGGSSSSRCTGMAPIKPAPITRTEKEYPLVCKKLTCVIQVLTVFPAIDLMSIIDIFDVLVFI